MEQLRKSLSEKEDLAQEEALIKETQARQALQEQLREQQDQHREETDRLLRYTAGINVWCGSFLAVNHHNHKN